MKTTGKLVTAVLAGLAAVAIASHRDQPRETQRGQLPAPASPASPAPSAVKAVTPPRAAAVPVKAVPAQQAASPGVMPGDMTDSLGNKCASVDAAGICDGLYPYLDRAVVATATPFPADGILPDVLNQPDDGSLNPLYATAGTYSVRLVKKAVPADSDGYVTITVVITGITGTSTGSSASPGQGASLACSSTVSDGSCDILAGTPNNGGNTWSVSPGQHETVIEQVYVYGPADIGAVRWTDTGPTWSGPQTY